MHTRNLLVASLSLLATSAIAQTQYAWVGTYNPNGEGVYRFTLDPQTGALGNKTLVSKLPNAAQLTASHDGKTLYVASEVEQGVVQALRVGDNGELSELNQVASGGAGPVYLSLPVLLLPVLGAIGFANTTFSDADFGAVGIVLGNLARYLSPMAITGLVVALFALLVAYNVFAKNKTAGNNAQENTGAKS
jgi:hypothetical protein